MPTAANVAGQRARWRRRQALQSNSASGFTLLEVLLVVAVMGIMLAIAVPSIRTALIDARANGALRAVHGHLRAARDSAISLRRVVEVEFVGTSQIRSTRIEGTTRTLLQTTILENGMQFQVTAGLPDTPDAFGNAAAVNFGGPTLIYFQPDGTLGDITGLPISGTVNLGTPARTLSARAVTVLGPTGRVQPYRWDGSAWR